MSFQSKLKSEKKNFDLEKHLPICKIHGIFHTSTFHLIKTPFFMRISSFIYNFTGYKALFASVSYLMLLTTLQVDGQIVSFSSSPYYRQRNKVVSKTRFLTAELQLITLILQPTTTGCIWVLLFLSSDRQENYLL